jgi:uncharacterized protein (TIGR02246 family)
MVPLHDLAQLLVETWNHGDADAFARLFTPNAEYIAGTGERLRGRHAIAQLLARTAPVPQVCLLEAPLVQHHAGLTQLSFAWCTVEARGTPMRGRITCTCARHEAGWLIEELRNDEVAAERGN